MKDVIIGVEVGVEEIQEEGVCVSGGDRGRGGAGVCWGDGRRLGRCGGWSDI